MRCLSGSGGAADPVPGILTPPLRLACPPGVSAEAGTIAGVASALAMALIGAVSSYISYQQKKFCFSIQRKCAPPRPAKWGAGPPQGDGARPGARAESDLQPGWTRV